MAWLLAIGALTSSGCRDRAAPVAPVASEHDAQSTASWSSFEGIVRVAEDPKPGPGKKFRGAWIERDGGERWVIDYERESPFRELRDRRVRVEGETYAPEGQALVAKHFRVRSMELVTKDAGASLVRVGPRQRVKGQFGDMTWPAGTKLAGETMRVFVTEGGKSYFLARVPETTPAPGVTITVDAHEVEPSPFVTRPGGPYLWIRRVVEGE
jgi:hypothetical protein